VEVAASGEGGALQRFRSSLEQGPPGAAVSAIDELPEPAQSDLTKPFTILR
jgi:acylphosphatase